MKFLLSIMLLIMPISAASASSSQAYKDYLYQFDVYRQKYSDFKVAKNEYLKFRTLTSQTTALEATKLMLSHRDALLRAYLLLLAEKINENPGMGQIERNTYQTLIRNEVVFLEGHSSLVSQIGSLEDATKASNDLQSHYDVLQSSMRQTISAISLGELSHLAKSFDIVLADGKAIVSANRGTFLPEKQATLDRWILQISNVRTLYQQKVDITRRLAEELRGSTIDEQNQRFSAIQKGIAEGRQYLVNATGYLHELGGALRFQN